MPFDPAEFTLEEFRQLKTEWATFIGRNESLARYSFLGAAAVYSWLVTEGFGVDRGGPCLELPPMPLKLAWYIPALFTFLTGCVAATQTYRAYQIGQYLKLVEKIGLRGLGWEAWIGPKFSVLTIVIGLIWLFFLSGTILIGVAASCYIESIDPFCPPPK